MTLCRRSERRQARRLRRPGLPVWTEDEAPARECGQLPEAPGAGRKEPSLATP